MSQSELKETGQAYCAYCSRETLVTYGGRQLLVCRKTLISMEERTFSRGNPAYVVKGIHFLRGNPAYVMKRIHFFARESKGNPPTGRNFQHSTLLQLFNGPARSQKSYLLIYSFFRSPEIGCAKTISVSCIVVLSTNWLEGSD